MIDIIDIAANKVVKTVPVDAEPTLGDVRRRGQIRLHRESRIERGHGPGHRNQHGVTTIPVGTSPHSLEVSPDGQQVAVVCYDSNDVYFIDTATNTVIGKVPVGQNPQDLTYAPDGRYLYTANVDGNTVSVIDTGQPEGHRERPDPFPDQRRRAAEQSNGICHQPQRQTLTILNAGG